MEKYDFLLMYEHKVREFDNLCLLKYELDRRGYRTKILYVNDWEFLQTHKIVYETRVLVIGYCYTSSSIKDYASYRIKFDKVVNLQWEQVITNEQENNSSSFRNLSGLAKEIVHISWGEKNRRRLIEKAGVLTQNVKVAGNITMDLLRPEFKGFYLSRDEICDRYGLPKDKKICLFISGFKFIEASEQEKAETIKRFGEGRRRYLEVAEKEQLTILQWFEQFLKERDDFFIVYRPHPGDASPRAEKMAEKYENFVVISELSVKQWIVICDLVCSWNSTAMLEAFFAGRDPFFLCPYPIPEDQDHPLFTEMNKITDYAEFYRSMTGDRVELGLTKEMVTPYYLVDEETPSYVKICNDLESVYRDPQYDWTTEQKRQYWNLYSIKERIAIMLMKHNFLYGIYVWMLENLPFKALKRRKEWLSNRTHTEELKWKRMNAIELEDDHEIEETTAKIKEALEG